MNDLNKISKLVRAHILESTTKAGSGHPSSSLSATDLLTVLMFGGFFHFKADDPDFFNNDRLIFSKGHAAPLLYALWAAAGKVTQKGLDNLRIFNHPLEGHPSMNFAYTEAATGSLGQGLSIGLGMALNAKYLDQLNYRTFVLLGDSEMAEGSVWEALQLAAYYKLDNLVGILDVNRLGQRGETMYGHDLDAYEQRIKSFGWETFVVDGHDMTEIERVFNNIASVKERPVMIIAKTIKGKGVPFIENKNGWHGKPLDEKQLTDALAELGKVDRNLVGKITEPATSSIKYKDIKLAKVINYKMDMSISTRKAYGQALLNTYVDHPEIVVLDAETSNSTYAETFGNQYSDNFFEMYIAEQNMVGTALGFSRRGKIPFISTFSAFFSRAYDQIRMSQYSNSNIKIVGSHAGVSIGQDGASQMGLEDIAMFRSLHECVVLYPSDGQSTLKLVDLAAQHQGNVYIRTTRSDTPILYNETEKFEIGGSKTLKSSKEDKVAVIAAGITLHEALKAYEVLKSEGIKIRIIDLYSIKPLDQDTILKASKECEVVITVEDHHLEGGLGEAINSVLVGQAKKVVNLAVTKLPKSGKPEELMEYEGIDSQNIILNVKKLIK